MYLFFAIYNLSKHMSNFKEMEMNFVKKINRLFKARVPNQESICRLLRSTSVPQYEKLTAINPSRTNLKTNQIKDVIELLTIASEDFLAVEIVLSDNPKIKFNPMDAIYNALKNALPESNRILITNLDKMKLALPLIIPNYSAKPKINIWPFIEISRQTREKSFNLFNDSHHVVAGVRLA